MKHTTIFSLPALLRPALLLAAASQHSFSVGDDILAFPQYEVRFSEDWVSDTLAQSRLDNNGRGSEKEAATSEVEHYRPSDQQPSSEGSEKKEEKFLYERLSLEGQPYLCSIPQVSRPDASSAENDTLTKLEQEKELVRANERGWELLSGMQGQCVYYISGWWSYKFCFNDGVRQFHQLPPGRGTPVYPPVEDSEVPGFTLGAVKKEDKEQMKGGKEVQVGKKADGKPLGELVQRGDSTYLLQRLEGGTLCDLTRKPRRIDVQFHCNPSPPDRISLIKEISTCAYLMVIQTPRLCKDVAFLPPEKDQPNPILCSPILSSEQDIADYERDMAALKQAEAEAEVWAAEPEAAKIFLGNDVFQEDFPIVGDIAIGARNIVPEGVTIEKSVAVGGKGDETYIDTIASSDGRVLTKEELEKLGLKDLKSVERLRKQLEQYAGGQDWKLDVVETAGGRKEYRGVIGSEEEDEQGKGEKNGEGEGGGQGGGQGEGGEEGSEEELFKEEL